MELLGRREERLEGFEIVGGYFVEIGGINVTPEFFKVFEHVLVWVINE